jgi:hypothetical protein
MGTFGDFFREGGFGMWPTLVFGVLAFGLALKHAIHAHPESMPLLIGLGLATLMSGALGAVSGFMMTFQAIQQVPQPQQGTIAMLGVSESLANLVLALVFCTLVPLLAGIGTWRERMRLAAA